jgi:V8-like Glu-specific endopeptidase
LFLFAVLIALVVILPAGGSAADRAAVQSCQAGAPQNQRIEVGRVLSFDFDSPHPLPASFSHTFNFPGAAFLRLHFQDFNLAPGDMLVVSSLDGSQVWEYTGLGTNDNGDFWSFAVNGEGVKVDVLAPSGQSFGFRIVEAGYGTVNLDAVLPVPNVVCGDDGRKAVACYSDPVVVAAQKPVARLLFTSGGAQYLCTGELVRGSNASTLITNAHCMDTQTEVSSLQAKFNYQYTACGGTTLAATTDYPGDTLLKTNAERYNKRKGTGLDYTLLTLKNNPEATWGELIPTKAEATVGSLINFIQHPGGSPKMVGYYENSSQTIRCKVDTVNMTYGSAAPNSQIGYGCDSEGGSSGSAITRASDGKIVGLHHYGGVASSPCLNSATRMSLICTNAGNLLSCDNN